MGPPNVRKKPKRGVGDLGHTIAKAGISAVPIIGAPAAEIFSLVIVPPLSKRRDKWIKYIAEGLEKLKKEVKGFKIEELSKNPMFITTVMYATQTAILNHQKEKLKALRNAVLNAALHTRSEEDMQLMFLNFVNTLTTWHLRALKFFENPSAYFEKQGIPLSYLEPTTAPMVALEYAFPKLRGRHQFSEQLISDLFSRGLLRNTNSDTSAPARQMVSTRISIMGRKFINFIMSPFEDDE